MRDIRPQLIEVAADLLHNRARCIYTESAARWEWHNFTEPHYPFEGDCSSTVTAICWWAKGNDPSGVNWAYGDTDIFIITDFPEAEAATSLALALALTGSFRVTTTPLLTAKDMDAGAARMPSYRAPGT